MNLPPSPSPLRPSRPIRRRKYSDYQIAEAVKLALEVSVQFAVEQTGVPRSWIYKNLRPTKQMSATNRTWRAKAKKPSQEAAMLALPAYASAVKLAELWHSNTADSGISMLSCLGRAAEKMGLDKGLFLRVWKKQRYTGK